MIMNVMEGLEEFYRELICEREEKFLGFVKYENLKHLERILDTDLGVEVRRLAGEDPRKARPFIGWYSGDHITLVFLTKKKKSIEVDTELCKKLSEDCRWIEGRCYVLEDWKRGGFYKFTLRRELLGDYVLCGRCEDLDFLENLKEVTYEG